MLWKSLVAVALVMLFGIESLFAFTVQHFLWVFVHNCIEQKNGLAGLPPDAILELAEFVGNTVSGLLAEQLDSKRTKMCEQFGELVQTPRKLLGDGPTEALWESTCGKSPEVDQSLIGEAQKIVDQLLLKVDGISPDVLLVLQDHVLSNLSEYFEVLQDSSPSDILRLVSEFVHGELYQLLGATEEGESRRLHDLIKIIGRPFNFQGHTARAGPDTIKHWLGELLAYLGSDHKEKEGVPDTALGDALFWNHVSPALDTELSKSLWSYSERCFLRRNIRMILSSDNLIVLVGIIREMAMTIRGKSEAEVVAIFNRIKVAWPAIVDLLSRPPTGSNPLVRLSQLLHRLLTDEPIASPIDESLLVMVSFLHEHATRMSSGDVEFIEALVRLVDAGKALYQSFEFKRFLENPKSQMADLQAATKDVFKVVGLPDISIGDWMELAMSIMHGFSRAHNLRTALEESILWQLVSLLSPESAAYFLRCAQHDYVYSTSAIAATIRVPEFAAYFFNPVARLVMAELSASDMLAGASRQAKYELLAEGRQAGVPASSQTNYQVASDAGQKEKQ